VTAYVADAGVAVQRVLQEAMAGRVRWVEDAARQTEA
jgi:hypothetical protein